MAIAPKTRTVARHGRFNWTGTFDTGLIGRGPRANKTAHHWPTTLQYVLLLL